MNTIRPCGCKGIRSCLQCESDYKIVKKSLKEELQNLKALSYCTACELLYAGWDTQQINAQHPEHGNEKGIAFPGMFVQEDFLTANEAKTIIVQLDMQPWTISQSGRRKQNYGPKTNFKKRKLRNGNFHGFPAFTEFIQQRFEDVELLHNFQTIEQCSLEYDPTKGACIDPHIDDCWVWGERVVTVNCLGDAVLTLTPYDSNAAPVNKYSLDLVPDYTKRLISPLANEMELKAFKNCVIRVSMPSRSLMVMYGAARYQYEHAVLREDVQERRVCIAYREFTPMYIDGYWREEGKPVTKNSQLFWQHEKLQNILSQNESLS